MSRNEKELQFLLQRQKEFKMAALQAKKQGDIDAAKDYLRQAKVCSYLGCIYTRLHPFRTGIKLEQISIAFIRDLSNLLDWLSYLVPKGSESSLELCGSNTFHANRVRVDPIQTELNHFDLVLT